MQLFVLPEELDLILTAFVRDKGLLGCYCQGDQYVLAEEGFSILKDGRAPSQCFLLAPGQWSPHPRPRDLGWIQVIPGELVTLEGARALIMSTVAGEASSKRMRSLRRRFAKSFKSGVEGRNVKFGGSHVYKEIRYSPGALDLFEQGVCWKQFHDGHVQFRPAAPGYVFVKSGSSAPVEAPPEPERVEVEKVLEDLIAGRCSRENAADWAALWVNAEDPNVNNDTVWEALGVLAMADAKTTDRPYLYDESDFRQWLEDLRGQ
ncbi:MAG TPA: hypothetical protein VF173_31605 [Thermoanaerobaculia bacterium]|nr:hypothetical protein [Thermoanaerobaculia bacterium]